MIYIFLCVLQSLKKSETRKKEKSNPYICMSLQQKFGGLVFFLKMKMPNFIVHKAPQSCVEVVQVSGFMH